MKLDRGQDVTIDLVDLLGRRVVRLHSGYLAAGRRYQLRLDASALPSGTYYIRLIGNAVSRIKPIIVTR